MTHLRPVLRLDHTRAIESGKSTSANPAGSTRSTSDAFVYDAVTEELVQLTHSPNPATRDDPDISASVQAISANGNRIIVTGELVEFLPP